MVPWLNEFSWKYLTKFGNPSTETKIQKPNELGIPYKSLEWESKTLNTPGNGLKIATVLISAKAVFKFNTELENIWFKAYSCVT